MDNMNLFVKRAIAYILDFFVVSAFMWIFSYFAYFFINHLKMFQILHYFIFILPILNIIYFTFLEKNIGTTVGKRLMFIEVKSTIAKRSRNGRNYNLSYGQAFIRSLCKIYWFPIIIDVILGKIVGKTRFLEGFSKTIVVEEREDNYLYY